MLMLISDRAAWLNSLAARLHEKGVFLYLCHYGAARFYCEQKDIGGVFLDGVANSRKAVELCRDLHNSYPELPILLAMPPHTRPSCPATGILRADETTDPTEDILDFYIHTCGWRADMLSTFFLTITPHPEQTRYMGYSLSLSKQEHRILRCLFYLAPKPLPKAELWELCYPIGACSQETLTVLIGRINQKAKKIAPRPLIVFKRGAGYTLREGILQISED